VVTELCFYFYLASAKTFAFIIIRCVTAMFLYRTGRGKSLVLKRTKLLFVYISDNYGAKKVGEILRLSAL
jgi:hypothetical protein